MLSIDKFTYTDDDIICSDKFLKFTFTTDNITYVKTDFFIFGNPIWWRNKMHPNGMIHSGS